jgi:iron complex transport system permease protein
MNANRFTLILSLTSGLLLISLIIATGVGSVSLTSGQVFNAIFICPFDSLQCENDGIYQRIIWEIRLPRVLMAMITGAGLSITGAILQSVTRNPLADPYLFGISSGSALGAVLVISAFSGAVISVTVGALIGGIFSVVLMLVLAGNAAMQVEKLLLSGVAVSFMLSAFTSLVIYYSETETARTLLFWMMGSFSNSEWHQLILPSITIAVGLALFVIYRHWIGAIQAGDEGAFTLGVPVSRLRLVMLVICSIITAVLVAQVGGIGFVGLMIPHICRLLVGSQLNRVLIMCVILGGGFMIWVDVVARSILSEQVLPVGIVTSALGSLFFFIILKTNRKG